MKVYVDKIPKCCLDCVCCDLDLEECKIDKKIELCQDYFNSFEKKKPTKCPLHSLSDYTKQVRKEVCEEIKEKSELFGVCKTGILKKEYRIDKDVLDQIQD